MAGHTCYKVEALPKGAKVEIEAVIASICQRRASPPKKRAGAVAGHCSGLIGGTGMPLTPAPTKPLNNPELFLDLAAEANQSVATTRKRFAVLNSSTGELLAEVPDYGC